MKQITVTDYVNCILHAPLQTLTFFHSTTKNTTFTHV